MNDKMTELATQLQQELTATKEFQDLKNTYEKLRADSDTFQLFKKFQQTQMQLQRKQMQGTQPTEAEINDAQQMATQMGQNQIISELMSNEKALNQVLGDVNDLVTKPIMELYRN
ncbi:UPF0342 protein [Lentilactobacillus fungorum]|uniref:UPF0342 protein YK48G_03660 n=1 Tax=Lentilactobacillus fungorum TaxID=2201250 RepID=A0ABQ3VY78_9LACO|nr:YlbF family regulator [Lentilactobacillus fungorum]GHP12941.1 UPF0342 protein [Lentilactobacillus fungorum]